MKLTRLALMLFVAGHAVLSGRLVAQVPTRTWNDSNGFSWQEVRQSNRLQRTSSPAVRQDTHNKASGIRQFGPFIVLDSRRAVLSGVTDTSSPRHFANLLAAFPTISVLEMRDCPGTLDDVANLRLGRMIRANGITTFVPAHGSVRSGAVDLFIAGHARLASRSADFGVHAWQDQQGLGPRDFPMSAPSNKMYVDYYRQMGMQHPQAVRFYNLTNAVANDDVIWLKAEDMNRFIGIESR